MKSAKTPSDCQRGFFYFFFFFEPPISPNTSLTARYSFVIVHFSYMICGGISLWLILLSKLNAATFNLSRELTRFYRKWWFDDFDDFEKTRPRYESNPKPFGVDVIDITVRIHWGPNSWIRIKHLAFTKPFVNHSKEKYKYMFSL